ncbi:short-chain dehydrogenase [Thecamonas trahens ATCC 50062]|uniref:Short-chain dehydrogenase n=1 Tax=Thecamonas trahens ATCC 50062 TaxID=461836 RepID=A0A0L0DC82_THETB|nr:short-chain dehydrogenase [Thecamonas trahens ATCC 50062]KNC49954.1 short-chain dehydrogenase [Thecamonas trahens ATCC 50062]|eukprot:XP_013757429.1 short-chain dehydrogenase [Thecamonas trahens ATCC 50062]
MLGNLAKTASIATAALAMVGGVMLATRAAAAADRRRRAAVAEEPRLCVVSGGSRGIGRAIAKGLVAFSPRWNVVVTASTAESAARAAEEIAAECDADGRVFGFACDVTDDTHVAALASFVADSFGRCDVLVNNAGVMTEILTDSVVDLDLDAVRRSIAVNTVGAMALTRQKAPISILGYRVSKAALNRFTTGLARELTNLAPGGDVVANAVCPGFINTDMTACFADIGRVSSKTPAVGAITPLYLATLPSSPDIPNGKFFAELEEIPW